MTGQPDGQPLVAKIRAIPIESAKAHVFDGLFDATFMADLYRKLVARPFEFSRANSSELADARFLTSLISAEQLRADPLLHLLATRTVMAVGKIHPQPLRLTRIQVNVTSAGDSEMIHTDAGFSITAIYYANPDWHPDWLGETMLYDSQDREVLGAITPIPGRLAVFPSQLRHRGGVPARACPNRRIAVALKFEASDPDVPGGEPERAPV